MARVTWTERAVTDLEDACRFIARDSPSYARLFAARVVRAIARLADFPRSGRIVPELGRDDLREVLVHRYRVVYRVISDDEVADEVAIVAVHHGARLLRDIGDA